MPRKSSAASKSKRRTTTVSAAKKSSKSNKENSNNEVENIPTPNNEIKTEDICLKDSGEEQLKTELRGPEEEQQKEELAPMEVETKEEKIEDNSKQKPEEFKPVETAPEQVQVMNQPRPNNEPAEHPPLMEQQHQKKSKKSISRKESFSLRGKRKSSYGELQSIVHEEIDPQEFHRHVSVDLPDPLRLRQVLVYCLQKEVSQAQDEDSKQKLSSVLQDLLLKNINTSWYHRPPSKSKSGANQIENPLNKELRARIRGYEKTLERFFSVQFNIRLNKEEVFWSEKFPRFVEQEKLLSESDSPSFGSVEVLSIAIDNLGLSQEDSAFVVEHLSQSSIDKQMRAYQRDVELYSYFMSESFDTEVSFIVSLLGRLMP
jgi:hypothetical protein